jgi:hypothetical protein
MTTSLTPKSIIIDRIRDQFEQSGITKALIRFNVLDDSYSVMLLKDDNTNIRLNLDKKDISLIKLIFVNKIRKKYDKENFEPMKNIILSLDVNNNEFEIFIEDIKKVVTKFNY